MDSFLGPAIEIQLHVIKRHPATLQETVTHAIEVDVILFVEALQKLEKQLSKWMGLPKGLWSAELGRKWLCYSCGEQGHYKKESCNSESPSSKDLKP